MSFLSDKPNFFSVALVNGHRSKVRCLISVAYKIKS